MTIDHAFVREPLWYCSSSPPPSCALFIFFGVRQVLEKGGTGCVMRTLVARQTV